MKNIPIGEALIQFGYLTEEQLRQALAYQAEHKTKRVGEIVVELGFVTERQVLEVLGKKLGLSVLDVRKCDFDIDAVGRIPRQLAEANHIIAYGFSEKNDLKVLTSDPLNLYGMEEVRQAAGVELEIHLAEKEEIQGAINHFYSEVSARMAAHTANSTVEETQIQEISIDAADGDAPIIRLVQSLLVRAYNVNASDVHIEPFEDKTLVRMRIDGMIVDYVTLQNSIHASVIARIKIMANLDIAEKRIPQDGHFRTKIDGENVNVRVSVIPTVFGEKAVMRLLASKTVINYAEHFGMNEDAYRRFLPMLSSPNGIIYITGPTGSGKSTTLYMVLEALAGKNVNISTIEDPVEKNITRINQVQVNPQAGVTFETGLRALLRQDPDIIMIGETRDAETASISVRAAITGHLVLSTLHTNDAVSSVVRLMDMGIEPYLIASSLIGLVAQRLMKKVCPHCCEEVETTEEERTFMGEDIRTVVKAKGCPACNNTGYSGRIAIHEVAVVDKEMRALIAKGSSVAELTHYVVEKQHMKTLKDGGLELVKKGITTVEELVKVAYYST